MQRGAFGGQSPIVIGSGRARFLSRGRCRHLGCHHGHELHVGFERQAGHVDDPTGDVLDIGARLDLAAAGGLQAAAGGVLVAAGGVFMAETDLLDQPERGGRSCRGSAEALHVALLLF